MIKPFNPYQPGTILYKLLDGADKWGEMTADEIADNLGCSSKTVYQYCDKIKNDIGYNIKRRDKRNLHMLNAAVSGDGNIYKPGSMIYKLYKGNWSEKTTKEIADELGTKSSTIINYIWIIRKDTGKFVEFLDGRKVRWKNGKTEK